LTAEKVGFGLDFKMGVTQRSLGPMTGGVSPLRTPFMAALIAFCLIGSILSLDMSRVKSSVVRPLMIFEKRELTSLRNRCIRKLWIP
jgi:hypothetical protein